VRSGLVDEAPIEHEDIAGVLPRAWKGLWQDAALGAYYTGTVKSGVGPGSQRTEGKEVRPAVVLSFSKLRV